VLKDANDVLIGTWDNLVGINSNFVNYTVQEEIQTATAGQTVFTLTTTTYTPGTNSLSVFVDGVNQYDGVGYAFVETDATTVTFTAGLHVGALVKFTTAVPATGTATNAAVVVYNPAGTGAVTTTVQAKLRQTVSVQDFGAVGDGTTDDTVAIQAAIDSLTTGGVVYFPTGEYRIARNIGTNDRWGIKIPQSNITLKGEQASLRRFNTDISTYALAYPILFLGTPDSNIANATENIVIDGLTFIGEDTQHAISGSYLSDFRDAITVKNTNGTLIQNCTFTKIDSQAITYEWPYFYDYANSTYYNTTKNYNSKILGCSFIAESHSTASRALIHAIALQGVDFCVMDSNYFEWCDDAATGEGTYGSLSQSENDLYNPSGFGNIKRSGRNWIFSNNTVYNSSEHCAYLSSMDVVITGNSCRTDEPTICAGDIKTRSQNCTISNNTVVSGNDSNAIAISEGSAYVTVSNNTVYSASEQGGGAISISSVNLSTYISNRPWFSTYFQMANISIVGNSITMPSTSAPSSIAHRGIRIVTAATDVNYPEGQIANITINGNTFINHYDGIVFFNGLTRNVNIDANTFLAKPFTTTGFNAGTTLNTNATVLVRFNSTFVLENVRFSNNSVNGSTYVFATDTGGGTNVEIPHGIQANKLDYIKNFMSSDMKVVTAVNGVLNNTGIYFLDRTTWAGNTAIQNSLNNGTTSTSSIKYNIVYTGAAVRFYTDDAGTYVTLGP
jgi:mannitol/fructose-specific phosphotransferase system IIA component